LFRERQVLLESLVLRENQEKLDLLDPREILDQLVSKEKR